MNENLARIAYEKVSELERRLAKLEQNSKRNEYKTLVFSAYENEQRFGFHERFSFEAVSAGTVTVYVSGQLGYFSQPVPLYILVNEIDVDIKSLSTSGFNFSFEVPVFKGLNELRFSFSDTVMFKLDSVFVTVGGSVKYVDNAYRMEVYNLLDRSYLILRNNKNVSLKLYDGIGLYNKAQFTADVAAISGCIDDSPVVALLDGRILRAKILSPITCVVDSEIELDDGISFVCGSKSENSSPIFYAVKGGSIYRYEINSDLTVTKTALSVKGKYVYASPNVSGAIIVTDFNGNSKLIVD